MSKSCKRDPRDRGRWLIDTAMRLPDGSTHHLGEKGYRTSHEAEVTEGFVSKAITWHSGFEEFIKAREESIDGVL